MITNSGITIYHKKINETTRLEEWERFNYIGWLFGGKGASISKGYNGANNVEIRIPYSKNEIDISNLSIGDIVCKGTLTTNITTQQDLEETYNITSIKDNQFGSQPHIHIGAQ